ncbi:MAG: addiction module toxin RelE, partial [Gammaproteobacteria bacterium]|nr:addiction module toxin RelE [Gammaproteobacteria bacterium]
HQQSGSLFQGRYKAIIAEKKSYLLRLNHHIVRAPQQAGLCRSALQWRWSSYQATFGAVAAPAWLDVVSCLHSFGKQNKKARDAYRSYIRSPQDSDALWTEVQQQIYLGSPAFIKRLQKKMAQHQTTPQHSSMSPTTSQNQSGLENYQKRYKSRNRAISAAYLSGKYTLQDIGHFFDLHYTTVSRIVKQYEQS